MYLLFFVRTCIFHSYIRMYVRVHRFRYLTISLFFRKSTKRKPGISVPMYFRAYSRARLHNDKHEDDGHTYLLVCCATLFAHEDRNTLDLRWTYCTTQQKAPFKFANPLHMYIHIIFVVVFYIRIVIHY
jgi:hypothetical protein